MLDSDHELHFMHDACPAEPCASNGMPYAHQLVEPETTAAPLAQPLQCMQPAVLHTLQADQTQKSSS
jgi:hypothetical protein